MCHRPATSAWLYIVIPQATVPLGKSARRSFLPRQNIQCKEPDRVEGMPAGKVPIDRLADIAPACRIITAGGIASGTELSFHLLRRAGYAEDLIGEVARVMEYHEAYKLYRDDLEGYPSGAGTVT